MPAPDIANAEYTGSGIEVTYRCNPEYRMENPGNNKLVCRDGQWTGTWPSCGKNLYEPHHEKTCL